MYLTPSSTHTIPAHRSLVNGQVTQQLAVDIHEFPGSNSNRKVAFIFSHGGGFHKEVLHPIMQRLLNHLRTLREYDTTDITFVSWDDRNHGESGRLNKDYISEQYRIFDNGFDARQVIEAFKLNTSKYDQFIGVGHSIGASGLLLCEHFYPGSIDGLCIIEAAFSAIIHSGKYSHKIPIMAARKRRKKWANREECCADLTSKDFFKKFDPEAMDLYLKYGFYDTTEGAVELICSGEMEYITYLYGAHSSFQAFKALQVLSIPAHVVLAKKTFFSVTSYRRDSGAIVNKMVTVDIVDGSHTFLLEDVDRVTPFIMKVVNRVNAQQKTLSEAKL